LSVSLRAGPAGPDASDPGRSNVASDAIALPFQDGLVILNPAADRILACNAGAAAIWDILASGGTAADAAAALAAAYDLAPDRAVRDVDSVVAIWAREGLLRGDAASRAPAPAAADDPVSGASRAAEPRYYAIGPATFRLTVSDPAVAARLLPLLHPFEVAASVAAIHLDLAPTEDGATLTLRENGCARLHTDSIGEAAGAVLQAMLEAAHPQTRWLCLIHGAAVAGDGGAILLPGRSGSGKSTLSASLTARGFDHLSDDMIPLAAPDGAVMRWPIPTSVKAGAWQTLTPLFPALADAPIHYSEGKTVKFLTDLSRTWHDTPVPSQTMIFPTFAPGAAGDLRRLTPIESLERLMSDNVWLGRPIPVPTLTAFLRWVERMPSYAISYASLDQAWALVDRALASRAETTADATVRPEPATS
jgi:hypothetical protein